MPSIKQEYKVKTSRYEKLAQGSREQKETKDCGVIALAAITGKAYKQCHDALATQGRKPKAGTLFPMMQKAAKVLGFKLTELPVQDFISQYPKPHNNLKNISTHRPDRFPKIFNDGCTYLLQSTKHYSNIVKGKVHDWSKGRQLQMHSIYKVTPRKAS